MLLSICLIFCQFQPGVAYKSVAYIKKSVYITSSGSASMAVSSMFGTGKKIYNLASWPFYPVDTRRRFTVRKMSIRRQWCRIYRRLTDVETTSCVYWVEVQEINLRGNMRGSKCDEHCIFLWNLFLFHKNVLSPLYPVAFFFAIFLLQPHAMFLTHLYKSVICSFTKRGYKFVITRNSSAQKFLEVNKGIERLQQKRLRQTPFFRSRLRASLVIY